MTDRIALVDAEGRVVAAGKPFWDRSTEDTMIDNKCVGIHFHRGGAAVRVPDTVKVGDQWPGVCGARCIDADSLDLWVFDCGSEFVFGATSDRPRHCPGCGKPVSAEGEA